MKNIKEQLTSDPIAAKRTIERIRIHESSLSPDFLLLFPQGTLEEQQSLISKYTDDMDPLDFWSAVLN